MDSEFTNMKRLLESYSLTWIHSLALIMRPAAIRTTSINFDTTARFKFPRALSSQGDLSTHSERLNN